ncbi:hypothetical protein BHM03_00043460 [Ensete ventricosum]|nr:hypothetical protein BHM03_00043460 [Ensete ventricosum]
MTGRGSAEASSHCLGCRPANTRWIEAFGRGGGRCSRPPACKVQMKQSCALAAGAEGLRYTDSSGLGGGTLQGNDNEMGAIGGA